MSALNNSVETVNAAATAIITAESRVQPTTVQKRRWASRWSIYWCFGSNKQSKRIDHAVLLPESTASGATAPVSENTNHSTTVVLPFIAPPSSPASFLQSDPPSVTQSPGKLLSLKSLSVNAFSSGGTASIFDIGPYAYETQLVSPPVFSTFTTEPSTASFTPPPEPLQLTTPSSPEVPFAQLLASSLARSRRDGGATQKLPLSQYEYQPYQQYPGSPGGHLISPGSTISNSGTSSPFPDKRPILEFPLGEAPKFLGYEHFSTYMWGSRLGSGSLTPNGWGSRLGSGSLTPNGWGSRLGSGSLTPNGGEPISQDNFLAEIQISEVASLANSDNGSQNEEVVIGQRVSFELTSEDVPSCLEKKLDSSLETVSEPLHGIAASGSTVNEVNSKKGETCCIYCLMETSTEIPGKAVGEGEGKQCHCKRRSITLGSSKEFNFDSTKEEVSDKSTIGCEWWTSEKIVGKELSPQSDWTFFPVLQPEVR
ncbi:hypothetical protein RJ640_023072 [Escallonia rubra]|uniref:Hydroxyproline-rich glycoprotein family protein n=1 Tax=Escallonia rubra TaxID=112253 RepID=A0AA88R6V9_9ASTE|nr:hypothetical protein RJ640_023072 [Escallonia rubra]